ncbi:LolA family protein [Pseudarthrobacter sp. LMD1-1-1.1]|uniref:LolA family protein n=1 Tax=Pseudarthrobacter sp. LMD1-1-1.1 TaxID=3135242 RepID=UPI003414440B
MWLRWLPAVAAPVAIASGALIGSLPAGASNPLPTKTPAEVLELAASHQVRTFSGTVEQSAELGLPELPAAGKPSGSASGPASAGSVASVIELLSGKHTARIYVDGKDNARVQVMDQLAERDVVRHGSDVWLYSSKDNSAAHLSLPAHTQDPAHTEDPALPNDAHGAPGMHTPAELAQQFLSKVDPSTAVSVGPDVSVAGRAAYNLLIEPRTDATLVGKVAIAVDGASGMPLSVQVTARGADKPAFASGFTSFSLDAPDPSVFAFTPPPGSTVKELPVPDKSHDPAKSHDSADAHGPGAMHGGAKGNVSITGTGWETVVGTAAGSAAAAAPLLQDPLLSQAAVAVPGGRLLSTALLNILITDDGRIFAGMVPPERLQAAAAAAR